MRGSTTASQVVFTFFLLTYLQSIKERESGVIQSSRNSPIHSGITFPTYLRVIDIAWHGSKMRG